MIAVSNGMYANIIFSLEANFVFKMCGITYLYIGEMGSFFECKMLGNPCIY